MVIARSTKDTIIQKGAELIHLKGYSGTGLNEILHRVDVPKGSFYFYFKSKEDFGLEVIDYFICVIFDIYKKYLVDDTAPALQRFSNLIDFYVRLLEKQKYTLGCPIGNLSLEMADTNDRFRERLDSSISRILAIIEECVALAQKEKSVGYEIDATEAARFIFYGFEGAMLHVKVVKSITPLITFRDCVLAYLTKQAPEGRNPDGAAMRGL